MYVYINSYIYEYCIRVIDKTVRRQASRPRYQDLDPMEHLGASLSQIVNLGTSAHGDFTNKE